MITQEEVREKLIKRTEREKQTYCNDSMIFSNTTTSLRGSSKCGIQ